MKHRISRFAILLCVGLLSALGAVTVSAQGPSRLTGKVSDADGAALPGVFVSVKGTGTATVTDAQGNFELSVPASAKELTFEMLGYKTVTEQIGSRALFSVMLEEDLTMLDETVVVGYGTMIRKELTSSVASVSSDDLVDRASAMNITQSMAGKMAGVQIRSTSGRPGDEGYIRVRGMGSINASSDPLYVVDGVVDVDPSLINYSDVEKIDVLKDAAATAMYGAKGANGVVMITTKSGSKGAAKVTFNTQTGVSILARRLDMMNSEEYMQAMNQAYLFSGSDAPSYLTTPNEKLFTYQMNGSEYVRDDNGYLIPTPKYDTDWQDVAYRPALLTTNNVTFTAGNDMTTVYANLGYQNNQGIYIDTWAKKYSGTFNMKSKLKKWLDVSFSTSVSRQEDKRCPEDWGLGWYNSAIENATLLSPLIPVQYEDGTYGAQSDIEFGSSLDNPVKIMEKYDHRYNVNNILLDGGLEFHIAKGLDLNVKGSYYEKKSTSNRFIAQGLKGATDTENMASVNNTEVVRWSNEDYLSYKTTFFDGKLKSDFVLGASWYYYNYETSTATAYGIPEELFSYHNLSTGTNPRPASSGYDHSTMNSYYFRTNQVLLGRYMLGFTMRADGASNFGSNKKFGYFPSVSAAWNIADEPWFAPAKNTVNAMKLRLSYGSVGNASIGSYKTYSQYNSGTIYMDGVSQAYVTFANLANKDLSWETIRQFDAGLDLGLWKDRVNIIADYYIKDSYDLLFDKTIPYTTGYSSTTMNIGQLRNRGFELTINSHLIDHKDFKWDLDLIWATNKTIAVDLVDDPFTNGSNSAIRAYKGQEYAQWYVYHRLGTWSTDEVEEAAAYGRHPGDPKIQDTNGDGEITYDDRILYGSVLPKGEVTIVNSWYWKGFSLSVDLGGMYGFNIFNHACTQQETNFGYNNTSTANLNAWTPWNQNTMIPALRVSGDDNNGTYYGYEIDDWYVEKADYLRVRNINLSYDFGYKLLKRSKAISGLVAGVNVENAYLFTAYTGYDPEMGSGYDLTPANTGSYPRPMVITGNIKITF